MEVGVAKKLRIVIYRFQRSGDTRSRITVQSGINIYFSRLRQLSHRNFVPIPIPTTSVTATPQNTTTIDTTITTTARPPAPSLAPSLETATGFSRLRQQSHRDFVPCRGLPFHLLTPGTVVEVQITLILRSHS